MKKIYIYLLLLCVPFFVKGQSIFDPEAEYLISCLNTRTGGIEPATEGIYPLIYNEEATENASRALWVIKEEIPGNYSIKNVETGQYIEYAPNNANEKFVKMSDRQEDSFTLFVINPQREEGSISYWIIQPVNNPNTLFDKRSYGAVGPYQLSNVISTNQLFSFKTKEGEYIEAPEEPEVPLPVNGIQKYFTSFTLNGKGLAYDQGKRIHYYSLAYDQMEEDIPMKMDFVNKEGNTYTVKVSGQEVENGSEYIFNEVLAGKEYSIEVLNGSQLITSEKVIFTGLPIVQLYTNGNQLSGNFSKGKIRVHEGSKTSTQTGELLNAEMRYRGATAMGYSKKAFAIKLRDENWKGIDRSFLGLRNDNYWILDAAAMDKSRIRNRVSTDIWNDFSADPYFKSEEPEQVNATRGDFVEVFIDDQYWGLYCMTERIDRKQLKLKKYQDETQTIRGVLYKAVSWSYGTMMGWVPDRGPDPYYGLQTVNNFRETWENFEVKYPDLEDDQPIDWEPLYDVINFVATNDNLVFKNYVTQDVDLPVWLDYYLLMDLILATDNHGKNAYYYMYNIQQEKKLGIAPWDMDGVLGIRWNGSQTQAQQEYDDFITRYEHGENYLFYRLKNNNVANFNTLLKKRYNELRFSYFTKDALIRRFADYMNIFEITGAAQRETERWSNYQGMPSLDFEYELNYLADWISDRLDFLDNKYGPLEPPTGTESIVVEDVFEVYPNPVVETLYVRNVTTDSPVWVYTESGACIYQDVAKSNSLSIDFNRYPSERY
ncbi:MAG: CotH kinase family protein, partial [Bacteroidales bacterium]|nr:CotH kinase family protein [Bacteroidales bacterium]